MPRTVIFNPKMDQGYKHLRDHVQPDVTGRLVGQQALRLLVARLNGSGQHTYEALTDPAVRAISELPRQHLEDRPFELHDISYVVQPRRPPGLHNRRQADRLNRTRQEMVEVVRRGKFMALPAALPDDDTFRRMANPKTGALLEALLPFQDVIPSVAEDMVLGLLRYLQSVHALGWQIVLIDGRPYLTPRRDDAQP